MSLIKEHLHKQSEETFFFELPWSDVDYLLSYLDEEDQNSHADEIREEILRQVYE